MTPWSISARRSRDSGTLRSTRVMAYGIASRAAEGALPLRRGMWLGRKRWTQQVSHGSAHPVGDHALSDTYADVAVVIENADAINTLLDSLPAKQFAAVHAALLSDSKGLSGRQLFIGDAVRRAQTKFGPRTLWLLRLVAAESGHQHIARALRRDPNATITDIGGVDLRGPVRLVAYDKKLKLTTLQRKRSALPTGGWASDIELVTLRKTDISTVLDAPIEWPADIVHLASQKAAAELESKNKHLQQVALDEEWFSDEA